MRTFPWCAIALLVFFAPLKGGETLTVKVEQTCIRPSPSFFVACSDALSHMDEVTRLEQSGAWYRVRTAAQSEGWLHSSAVDQRSWSLPVKGGSSEVSSYEASLAGKGFNEDVERKYRSQHAELNYAAVDELEKIEITLEEMQVFVEEGRLVEGGGR
jgi:hypothetical protein